MEGEKKQASSSFTNELFGSKESSSSSSSGLFHSIFPPPSKAHGKDYISSELTKKDHDSASRREKNFHSDSFGKEDEDRNPNKMDMSPFYEQERSQPCPLSSSIYYGGQDIYTNPGATKKTPGQPTQYSKDGEDDGRASRGNWWQGSLYY